MGAGRDPVDRVLDVLVSAPLCTAVAARDVVPVLARAARRGVAAATRAVLREDEHVPRPATEDATVGGADVAGSGEPGTARDVAAASTWLPIDGYDHLAARQVVDRLPGLTRDELEVVAAHERSHRRRRTVLGKIEQLLGA